MLCFIAKGGLSRRLKARPLCLLILRSGNGSRCGVKSALNLYILTRHGYHMAAVSKIHKILPKLAQCVKFKPTLKSGWNFTSYATK